MKKIIKAIASLAFNLAIAVLMAFPIKWLINDIFAPSLLHQVFGVYSIPFWTAFGLNVLIGILLSGRGK